MIINPKFILKIFRWGREQGWGKIPPSGVGQGPPSRPAPVPLPSLFRTKGIEKKKLTLKLS